MDVHIANAGDDFPSIGFLNKSTMPLASICTAQAFRRLLFILCFLSLAAPTLLTPSSHDSSLEIDLDVVCSDTSFADLKTRTSRLMSEYASRKRSNSNDSFTAVSDPYLWDEQNIDFSAFHYHEPYIAIGMVRHGILLCLQQFCADVWSLSDRHSYINLLSFLIPLTLASSLPPPPRPYTFTR